MEKRLSHDSGIAIGMVLFGLALLAVVSVAMGVGGNNNLSSVISIDRSTADLKSQGLLIATKIRDCFSNGIDNKKLDCSNNTYIPGTGWSRPGCSPIDPAAFYPASSGSGTPVENLNCPSFGAGIQNLWTGQVPALLPPPSSGFDIWYYVNAGDGGGRCIRTQPLASTVDDSSMRAGLLEASASFSANEVSYVPTSTSQRFILWITKPAVIASPDCAP